MQWPAPRQRQAQGQDPVLRRRLARTHLVLHGGVQLVLGRQSGDVDAELLPACDVGGTNSTERMPTAASASTSMQPLAPVSRACRPCVLPGKTIHGDSRTISRVWT
jgi:hypothetical protein